MSRPEQGKRIKRASTWRWVGKERHPCRRVAWCGCIEAQLDEEEVDAWKHPSVRCQSLRVGRGRHPIGGSAQYRVGC